MTGGGGKSVEMFVPSSGATCQLGDLPDRRRFHTLEGGLFCGGGVPIFPPGLTLLATASHWTPQLENGMSPIISPGIEVTMSPGAMTKMWFLSAATKASLYPAAEHQSSWGQTEPSRRCLLFNTERGIMHLDKGELTILPSFHAQSFFLLQVCLFYP